MRDYFPDTEPAQFKQDKVQEACKVEMVKSLIDAGWKRKFGTVWQSPSGALFHGPAFAHKMMLEHPKLAMKVTTGSDKEGKP